MSSLHKSINRNYLNRVNDQQFPKAKAATLAKKHDFDYWDGDRRICYGGYKYIPGRWTEVANNIVEKYKLEGNVKILDIGCGTGEHTLELLKKGYKVTGVDLSNEMLKIAKKKLLLNNLFSNNLYNLNAYNVNELNLKFAVSNWQESYLEKVKSKLMSLLVRLKVKELIKKYLKK